MIKKTSSSLALLLLANVAPLVGILFLEWSLFAVLFFYWLETVVVGIVNIPKMLMAQGSDKKLDIAIEGAELSIQHELMYWSMKALLIPFFVVHFGMFVSVHAVFLFLLYGPADITSTHWEPSCVTGAGKYWIA